MSEELREIDRACARALGYTVYHYDKDYAANCYYQLMDGAFDPVIMLPFRAGERKSEAQAWDDVPLFSTDYAAARLLEDEIERQGGSDILLDYLDELELELNIYNTDSMSCAEWCFLRATPEQRARAFLKVMDSHAHA